MVTRSGIDSFVDFEDEEDVDHEDTEDEDEWDDILEGDGDNEDEDEDDTDFELHPRCQHWTARTSNQLPHLRRHIEKALIEIFEHSPSSSLYTTLVAISANPDRTGSELLKVLENTATACSDTFAVALDIYALEDRADSIIKLLDSHSHLLRPQDAPSLQAATVTISSRGHTQQALKILQQELQDTARMIRQALMLSFSKIEDAQNKAELTQIMKLRTNSIMRQDRIEAWVDAIATPGPAEVPNPMMFAALMMGMPVPPVPGMNSDDDAYTYLDLDPQDPDLEDLRQEYRPSFKHRFESWADSALTIRNSAPVLLLVYKHLIEVMPFLRATDVTEEMIRR